MVSHHKALQKISAFPLFLLFCIPLTFGIEGNFIHGAVEEMANGHWEKAESLFTLALKSNNNDIRLHINRAKCRKEINDSKGVVEDAKSVFKILEDKGKLGSKELPFIIYKAEAFNLLGHNNIAIVIIDKALAHYPKNASLLSIRRSFSRLTAVRGK